MIICDGCNVRGNWEHRCMGERSVVLGEQTNKPCECPDCRELDRLFPKFATSKSKIDVIGEDEVGQKIFEKSEAVVRGLGEYEDINGWALAIEAIKINCKEGHSGHVMIMISDATGLVFWASRLKDELDVIEYVPGDTWEATLKELYPY